MQLPKLWVGGSNPLGVASARVEWKYMNQDNQNLREKNTHHSLMQVIAAYALTSSRLDAELAGSEFGDGRLGTRLQSMLEELGCAVGESLSIACQDWAAAGPRG